MDVVISLVETPGYHNSRWLLEVSRVLKPGGWFWVQEPLTCRTVAPEELKVSLPNHCSIVKDIFAVKTE